MKKILLLLSLSLLLFNASGQILFDDNSGGLINGEEWYSFGNPEFDFSYYPVNTFAADPSLDIEEREYFGIGNAHYTDGDEAPFGLSGDPGKNFIQVTFSAGSVRYPTSLEVRLRTIDEKLFTAYLYQNGQPAFVEQTVIIPLSEFVNVDLRSQKATASDIAAFSTIQFMFGLAASDLGAGFTIHKAELVKGKVLRTIVYDGTANSLVNGDWYNYGNKDTRIIEQHPLTVEKTWTSDDVTDDDYYYGVGNARYVEGGTESFGLSGDPGSAFFEVNLSYYSYVDSRLDIRFKSGAGTEFSYRLLNSGFHDIEDQVLKIPVSQIRRLGSTVAITAQELEEIYEVGFNIGFSALVSDPFGDHDLFFQVTEIVFEGFGGYCIYPDKPVFAAESIRGCFGTQETINLTGGELNDAEDWFWYKDECGGEFLGKGNSLDITISGMATLYVRGEGAGECELIGQCAPVFVEMIPMTTDDEVVQITGDNHTTCTSNVFNFEATSHYHNDATLYQWYLNDEPYGALSSDNTVTFEGLSEGDRVYVEKTSQKECTDVEFVSSLELTVTCSPVTSFMKETLGITSAYVAGDRLVLEVNVAELSGDIQVTNATGVTLGHATNVNLKETITLPVVSENGLIIVNLVTDKGVYNQKLMVR